MAAGPIATIPVDGGRIAYRRLGRGRPLIVLNGLAATSADWDLSFIDRLASGNEIVLLDNRGIGASTDDGAPFDIAKLAGDTARVIEVIELVDRQAAAMDAWQRNGAGDRLRELRAPTLIATGTEDIVIPAPNALALVNAIPGAWLAQFKGAGHVFMAQYPRSLADLINEFLAL